MNIKQILLSVSKISLGTVLSQLILFIATPFLTRIYDPETYGIYNIYIAIVIIVSSISSFKIENSIVTEKKNNRIYVIFLLCIFISLLISTFVFLVFLMLKILKVTLFDDLLVLIVPFLIFLISLFNISQYMYIRLEMYGYLGRRNVSKDFMSVLFQLILGLKGLSHIGLIFGQTIGYGIVTIISIKRFLSIKQIKKNINIIIKKSRYIYIKAIRNYKYLSIYTVFKRIAVYFPTFILGFGYSPAIAGYYSVSNRILQLPVSFIVQSVNTVLFREFSKRWNEGENIYLYIKKLLVITFVITIVPLIVITFWVKDIFVVFLGQEWEVAGVFATYMIFWVYTVIFNGLIDYVVNIFNIQRIQSNFEILAFILRTTILIISVLSFKPIFTIILYSLLNMVLNISLTFILLIQTKKEVQKCAK